MSRMLYSSVIVVRRGTIQSLNSIRLLVPSRATIHLKSCHGILWGPLPTSSCGNKYILVVTDLFTKWVEAFPLAKTDSVTLAKVLVNEIVCRYGVPRYLHSDQGANLVSEVIKSLCATLGINRTQTTAYHQREMAR